MGSSTPPHASDSTVHRSDRVLPSFLHLITGNGLRVASSLGALAIVARWTTGASGAVDTFVVFLTVTALLELLAGQWLLSTVLRFATEEYTETGRMARTLGGVLLFWLVGLLLLLVAGIAAAGRLVGFIGLPRDAFWTLAVCGYPLLSVSRTLLPGFLQAAGRSRAFAYFPLIQPLAFVALLFITAFSASGGVQLTLPGIVFCLVVLARVVQLGGAPRLERPFLVRVIAYSLPFLLVGVSAQVVQNVDIIVLEWFDLAMDRAMPYKIAYTISGYLQMVPNMSILILLPLFLERRLAGRHEGMRRYFGELVPQFLFPLALGLGLLATVGGPLLSLFRPEYARAEPALALLLFSVFFATLMAVDSPLFRSHDKLWGVALITVGMALANVLLDCLLIPRYATTGAALATLCVFAAAAVARIALLASTLSYRHFHYLIYALPLAIFCLLTLAIERMALRLPIAVLLAVVCVFAVRYSALYRTATLRAFEHARLPAPLFAGLLTCYRWLSKEKH